MTSSQIRQKILERLDELSDGEQRRLLEFAENLPPVPKGTPGSELLKFFGTIDAEDCRRMATAINAGRERMDSHDG
jgi:hypothetical protein